MYRIVCNVKGNVTVQEFEGKDEAFPCFKSFHALMLKENKLTKKTQGKHTLRLSYGDKVALSITLLDQSFSDFQIN